MIKSPLQHDLREVTLIRPDQIEEWIREVEERPISAPAILRYIASRLADLAAQNEALTAENIALRSGKKVEDFESRIASLEYQLDLLKRHAGEAAPAVLPADQAAGLLLFNARGQVLRLAFRPDELVSGSELARFASPPPGDPPPSLLAAAPNEELLFAFDSGRAITQPLRSFPPAEGRLDWTAGRRIDIRPGEELVAALPIARMSLFEYAIQVSRRGCAKLILKSVLQSFIAKNAIGSGIKRKPDKAAALVLCPKDDRLVLATREGFLLALEARLLPYTSDEVMQLGPLDHVVSALCPGDKPSLLVLTNNGKAVHREVGWLEPASSFKSRGQALLSPSRREAGLRVIGAAAVDAGDWCAVLRSDGALLAYRAEDLFASGAIDTGAGELLSFTTFTLSG